MSRSRPRGWPKSGSRVSATGFSGGGAGFDGFSAAASDEVRIPNVPINASHADRRTGTLVAPGDRSSGTSNPGTVGSRSTATIASSGSGWRRDDCSDLADCLDRGDCSDRGGGGVGRCSSRGLSARGAVGMGAAEVIAGGGLVLATWGVSVGGESPSESSPHMLDRWRAGRSSVGRSAAGAALAGRGGVWAAGAAESADSGAAGDATRSAGFSYSGGSAGPGIPN